MRGSALLSGRKRSGGFGALFISLAAFLCLPADLPASSQSQEFSYAVEADDLYSQIEVFSDALTLIKSDYVENVEAKDLIYGALEGMFSSLDRYSQFLDPDDYRELKTDTKGKFGGLGIEVAHEDGVIIVIAPLAGTPADEAGIKPGDKIIKIDNTPTKEMSLSDGVKKMRGEPGTAVEIVIYRESTNETLTFTMIRSIIRIDSIKDAQIIKDGIGYIRIVEFQEDTYRELKRALKGLVKNDLTALIIDLRNNPGGLLEAAIDVTDYFLEKGQVIVYTKSRIENQNKTFKCRRGNMFGSDIPIVCLINRGSASASEIFAGALRDHKRAIIAGEQSFGKGSVQAVVPLRDLSAVKITTASYFTPGGSSIMGSGIIPEIALSEKENHAEEDGMTKEGEIDAGVGPSKPPPDSGKESAGLLEDAQILGAFRILKGVIAHEGEEK